MAKPFRAGSSLRRLIDEAPIEPLISLFLRADPQSADLVSLGAEFGSPSEARAEIARLVADLPSDRGRLLEDDACRVLDVIAQGEWALNHAVRHDLSVEDRREFDAQKDMLGRSLWSLLHQPRAFANAESLHHAARYRGHGRLFEAFEIDLEPSDDLVETQNFEASLGERIRTVLDLAGPVSVTRLALEEDEGAGPTLALIVRHPGPLSSVSQHRPDGLTERLYFRRANEATLFYRPSLRRLEVCAVSPSVRRSVASAFAEVALGQDLSREPLTSYNYDLSRFHDGFELPLMEIDGFKLVAAQVTEVAIRPNHARRRIGLDVEMGADIEEVAEETFGRPGVLRKSGPFSLIAISVTYYAPDDPKERTLKIVVSDENKCDLRSNADPRLRKLGEALLEAWGVQTACRAPTKDEVRDLFPAMLALYDTSRDQTIDAAITSMGLSVKALYRHGFLKHGGRDPWVLIEEHEPGPAEVLLECPPRVNSSFSIDADLRRTERTSTLVRRSTIQRDWLRELIEKQLLELFKTRAPVRHDPCLVELGVLRLGSRDVRCHLARSLHETRVWMRLEALMRGWNDGGGALVLSAGESAPKWIGGNPVVALHDVLSTDGSDQLISLDKLEAIYRANRNLGLSAERVRFEKHDDDAATLIIPGKDPWSIVGKYKVDIVERLYRAYASGVPVVRTGELMRGTSMASPSQAFRDWSRIEGVYIGQVDGRGTWRLLAEALIGQAQPTPNRLTKD